MAPVAAVMPSQMAAAPAPGMMWVQVPVSGSMIRTGSALVPSALPPSAAASVVVPADRLPDAQVESVATLIKKSAAQLSDLAELRP